MARAVTGAGRRLWVACPACCPREDVLSTPHLLRVLNCGPWFSPPQGAQEDPRELHSTKGGEGKGTEQVGIEREKMSRELGHSGKRIRGLQEGEGPPRGGRGGPEPAG